MSGMMVKTEIIQSNVFHLIENNISLLLITVDSKVCISHVNKLFIHSTSRMKKTIKIFQHHYGRSNIPSSLSNFKLYSYKQFTVFTAIW